MSLTSTRLLLGVVLLVCSLRVAAQRNTPQRLPPSVDWQPVIEMDGQLFPSYVLATATAKLYDATDEDPNWLGDPNGMIGIRVMNPAAGTHLKLDVQLPNLTEAVSVYEGTLSDAGKLYYVFPLMRYDYERLPQLLQPRPATAVFTLYLNGQRVGQKTKSFPVRAITDCPYVFENVYGDSEDISWMFAAYVNENHPDVDVLLNEALSTGLVSSIDGYQSGQRADVYKQVFALWTVFQKRGLKYSSVTRPSGGDSKAQSQTVRPLGQALRLTQANCVDGTVLFASVLRKIELDPFLVLVPGHCFLGFYLDKAHKDFELLETTFLSGNASGSSSAKTLKLYGKWFGKDARHLRSWRDFRAAIDDANDTYDQYKKKLEDETNTDLTCQIIDIDECRKTGVMPINQPLTILTMKTSPVIATSRKAGKPGLVQNRAEVRRNEPIGAQRPFARQNRP